MQTSKNVQCKKCLNKFHQKEIYTIQQFQYKKQPKYEWTLKIFNQLQIDEWDSFCEECIMMYSKKLDDAWQNQKSQVL